MFFSKFNFKDRHYYPTELHFQNINLLLQDDELKMLKHLIKIFGNTI